NSWTTGTNRTAGQQEQIELLEPTKLQIVRMNVTAEMNRIVGMYSTARADLTELCVLISYFAPKKKTSSIYHAAFTTLVLLRIETLLQHKDDQIVTL
ncbi:9416_t:CDS:2, partial [Gigaspora margarita]